MNINYQKILDKELDNIIKKDYKPRLLLHSCCAPCSSYVLEYLSKYFYITVFYYNPNIQPEYEYKKRVEEQKEFIKKFDDSIDFIEGNYDTNSFFEIAKGLEEEREGGKRCYSCYHFRMKETAKLALDKGYDYFTTTLSISPHKNVYNINEIGEKLQEEFGVSYLHADFKKKNGYKRSIELSKEYNLYRQNYCGCIYSK